jgi:hypothetical protein
MDENSRPPLPKGQLLTICVHLVVTVSTLLGAGAAMVIYEIPYHHAQEAPAVQLGALIGFLAVGLPALLWHYRHYLKRARQQK